MRLSEMLQQDYMMDVYNVTMSVRATISAEALADTDNIEGLAINTLETLMHSFVGEIRNTARRIREEGIENDIAPNRSPRRPRMRVGTDPSVEPSGQRLGEQLLPTDEQRIRSRLSDAIQFNDRE